MKIYGRYIARRVRHNAKIKNQNNPNGLHLFPENETWKKFLPEVQRCRVIICPYWCQWAVRFGNGLVIGRRVISNSAQSDASDISLIAGENELFVVGRLDAPEPRRYRTAEIGFANDASERRGCMGNVV